MKARKKKPRRNEARANVSSPVDAHAARRSRRWPWLAALVVLVACGVATQVLRARPIPVFGFHVRKSYPHDPRAFCQGLLYADGVLYESTGRYGHSTVRRVRLETGDVLASTDVEAAFFGEGLVLWKDRLIQLTWQEGRAFVYDARSLVRTGEFTYPGEGWGLTHDGTHLVMSDGTAELRFLDPDSFREVRRVRVTADGQPVTQLNELEYIDGEIYANIWQADRIARIDPGTGAVTGWIDLTGLLPSQHVSTPVDVLNGIAWDPAGRRLFVTGKYWPKLFEIDLTRPT